MKKNFIIGALITCIFLIGFCLRFLYLDIPLWYDEACSWTSAINTFPSGIMNNLLNEDLQHTPLYFFLLHFWIKIFPQSEISMRVLSLIFGFLSLPLIYIVSRKIFDKKIAIYSTAICSVSPLLVLFSTEVRMYSLVIFLVLLSINFLTDYQQKNQSSSLIKLTVTNIFIPYTFVGGIFYNFSLLLFYSIYLFKNKKENFKKFIIAESFEWIFLIPYFILITYYASIRKTFIVTHEGSLHFSDIVDALRNFFGATVTPNVYWPSEGSYNITFLFTILVIVPCVYFIYGYIKSLKNSDDFVKTLGRIFCLCFGLAIVFGMLKVSILTVRYIIYILAPVIIIAVAGLFANLNKKHSQIFLLCFIFASLIFSINNAKTIKINKENAFKNPATECTKLGFDYRDVVIMPFGSDAPYYFKDITMPVIFNADFHKITRNPNGIYYDDSQHKILKTNKKYKFILDKINENNVFSRNFFKYFMENVYGKVENGRYAVLIMYGDDNSIIKPVEELRNNIKTEKDVKSKILYTMFSKYMCDIVAMLNYKFKFVQSFQKDNFTYYIYQKINK